MRFRFVILILELPGRARRVVGLGRGFGGEGGGRAREEVQLGEVDGGLEWVPD